MATNPIAEPSFRSTACGGRCVCIAGAFVALAAGAWVYLVDRGAAASLVIGHAAPTGAWLGGVGQWLPSFVHPFAFSLLSASLQAASATAARRACLGWWLVNIAFELGQHATLSPWLARTLRATLGPSEPVQRLAAYFTLGTFDLADLAAATAGAAAAAVLLKRLRRQEASHDPTSTP